MSATIDSDLATYRVVVDSFCLLRDNRQVSIAPQSPQSQSNTEITNTDNAHTEDNPDAKDATTQSQHIIQQPQEHTKDTQQDNNEPVHHLSAPSTLPKLSTVHSANDNFDDYEQDDDIVAKDAKEAAEDKRRTWLLANAKHRHSSRFTMETVVSENEVKGDGDNEPTDSVTSPIIDPNIDAVEPGFAAAANEDEKEQAQQDKTPEYGFGVPFSYWKDYEYYPYIAPKYQNLKEELLNNEIQTVDPHQWQTIYKFGEEKEAQIEDLLGRHGDPNTPFARTSPWLGEVAGIAPGERILLDHILALLFYTNLELLQCKMKNVCRKISVKETRDDVAKRHREMTVWLRLLFETIVFYGGRLSVHDGLTLYHGLDRKFYFPEFKMKLHIPTSTTAGRMIAEKYTKDSGVMLEFAGIESEGDHFFSTKSLSLYPDEEEYLFFFAELPIKSLYYKGGVFDGKALLLYQSIVCGNLIMDKSQTEKKKYQDTQKRLNKCLEEIEKEEEKKEENDEIDTADKYGKALLKQFINKTKTVWINQKQIISNVTMPKLRKRFIKEEKT